MSSFYPGRRRHRPRPVLGRRRRRRSPPPGSLSRRLVVGFPVVASASPSPSAASSWSSSSGPAVVGLGVVLVVRRPRRRARARSPGTRRAPRPRRARPSSGCRRSVRDPPGDGRAQHGDAGSGSSLQGDPVRLHVEDGPEDAGPGEHLVTGRQLHERVALAPGLLRAGTDEGEIANAEDDHQEDSENAELPLLGVPSSPTCGQDAQHGGRMGGGQWNGRLRRRERPMLLQPSPSARATGRRPHHNVGEATCSSVAGAGSPRCAKARGVAIRPRGVRWSRPCWRR